MSDAANPIAAARAIDALRRGWAIALTAGGDRLALLAVETADPARLAVFDPARKAAVLISAGRAATLKLANQLAAAAPDTPVLVRRTGWMDLAVAT
ncbi:MAG: GTP cyclohydrolase II, partial [Sphingomonas sp.]